MNSQRAGSGTATGLAIHAPVSDQRDILDELSFQRMVSLERKRTERSRKPFLLMLVDMDRNRAQPGTGKILGRVLSALSLSTRETDVTGWYKDGAVVGVMFTEICLEDRGATLRTMMARVSETLRSNLNSAEFEQASISFHLFPEDWDQEMPQKPAHAALYPEVAEREKSRRGFSIFKRVMDIVGSAVALLVFSPLFLAIAAAVKLSSRGPVFFRQQRVGRHGEAFTFLKFRSMRAGNDASAHKEYVTQLIAGRAERKPAKAGAAGVFKMTSDPRITKVGAFIRRTSLDELPQFINVLRGEMSLVGPRPPIGYEVEAYDIWHRRRVLEAKPGITGLWQVNGRSRVEFDDMVRLDLQYAREWSPWMDVKILLRTPAAMFGEGAY